MQNFIQLNWDTLDLNNEMEQMLGDRRIQWTDNQICLTAPPDHTDDPSYGVGSLYYDWPRRHVVTNNGKEEEIVPVRDPVLEESDFTNLCTVFYGTAFEEAYAVMSKHYTIGRVRLMKMIPRRCLSWHTDVNERLHYPLQTDIGAQMVIGNEVHHMPKHTWWHTKTKIPHTAFNATSVARIHLVACIL